MGDAANASELAEIAREVGADVFEGAQRYRSDTAGRQLGDLAIVSAMALAGAYLVVLGIANLFANRIESASPGGAAEAQHPIEVQSVEQAAPAQAPRGGSK